jgi:RND family efflux transporter MFP subunit
MKSVSILLLAMLLAACSESSQKFVPPTPRAALVSAKSGSGLALIRTTGTLAAKDQVPLAFKVSGVIARFAVDEGAMVKSGQLLAELERTEVESGVRQSRELSEKAARDLVRAESLYADKVITREQVEDARTAEAVARATLTSANFNAGYAAIRAPGPGVVLHRLAEARQLVQSGAPVLILANETRGWVVRASLSDRDVVQVRLGDAAQIRLDAYPGRVLQGVVSQITRAADERTGTFDLEVTLDVADLANPASGLLAKIDITPTSPAPALVRVPIECLIEGDQLRAWVFTYDAKTQRVRRKPVEVAFIDGTEVALRAGVTAGESLVAAGLAYLRDGDHIEIVTP